MHKRLSQQPKRIIYIQDAQADGPACQSVEELGQIGQRQCQEHKKTGQVRRLEKGQMAGPKDPALLSACQ